MCKNYRVAFVDTKGFRRCITILAFCKFSAAGLVEGRADFARLVVVEAA